MQAPPPAASGPRIATVEGMGPMQLFQRYAEWQRLPPAAAALGERLLGGVAEREGGATGRRHTRLEFERVEVEGYFRWVRGLLGGWVGELGACWVGGWVRGLLGGWVG